MHEEKQPMIDRSVCSFLSKDRDLKMVGQCISVGISCTHVPDADPVPAPAARHYRKIATLEISGTSPSSRAESATVAAVSISWTELPHQRALPPRSHGERSAALARPADPEESVEACLARLAADPAAAACPRSRRLDRRYREGSPWPLAATANWTGLRAAIGRRRAALRPPRGVWGPAGTDAEESE